MKHIPSQEQVEDLVKRAQSHELGTDFLMHGSLDAVAATFSVHAFVVDAARDQCNTPIITTEQKPVLSA